MKSAIAYSPEFSRHITPRAHPETRLRAEVIYQALSALDLLHLDVRPASLEELALCHSPEYIELVAQEVANLPTIPGKIPISMLSTGDVTICPDSFYVASLAVGATLVSVDAVLQKKAKNVFAIVRPPGHHASRDRGMGFCLFNNVAVACRYAQKKYGLTRMLIVDWDLHHGNGTQDIFYEDPSVFYFSTHQARIYPGTGQAEERGGGSAPGTKLNCPIPAGPGSKEAIFEAFTQKLIPEMKKFRPECVFISAGFDAHKDDPLGQLGLSDADYYELTLLVKEIAKEYSQDRLISVLEGGYNLEALRASSLAHVQALRF